MADINMASITAQVDGFLDSASGSKKVNQAIDEKVLKNSSVATTAAQDFIAVLQDEVKSLESLPGDANLGATGVSALTKLTYGKPKRIRGANTYQIDISFSENLRRDSLNLDDYDGIDNLAALINNGYRAKNKTYGIWLDHASNFRIPSRQQRPATNFIQNSMRAFKEKYGAKYKIIDVDCAPVYKERE